MIIKKTFSTALAVGLLFMTAQTSMADSGTTTAAAPAVQITDTTGGSGANLNFTPSPGVVMGWLTTADHYAITSTNLTASSENRMEYGVASDKAGYYQSLESATTVDAADAPTAWTAVPSDANFEGEWAYMGGAAAGGS